MSKFTAILFAAALAVPSVAVSQESETSEDQDPVLIGSLSAGEVTAMGIGLATFFGLVGGGGSSSSSTTN